MNPRIEKYLRVVEWARARYTWPFRAMRAEH
jgi:hypothetical protein